MQLTEGLNGIIRNKNTLDTVTWEDEEEKEDTFEFTLERIGLAGKLNEIKSLIGNLISGLDNVFDLIEKI